MSLAKRRSFSRSLINALIVQVKLSRKAEMSGNLLSLPLPIAGGERISRHLFGS